MNNHGQGLQISIYRNGKGAFMKSWQEYVEPADNEYHTKKQGTWSDNIYTFDCETTTLINACGTWQAWSRDIEQFESIKGAITYCWQFGAEDDIYFGRDLFEFCNILKAMSDKNVTKVIYIHNLPFEWQNCILDWIDANNWTVSDMIARAPHKPIQFTINELNIVFRCAYALTGLNLDESAKQYTNVKKASGDLDYKLLRGLTTPLTDDELHYCEMDIVTLREIIRFFRDKYGHIKEIPITQTGEVRKALNKEVGYYYHVHQWDLVPTAEFYMALNCAYFGGISNCNYIYYNELLQGDDVPESWDISSSYPAAMQEKFPAEPFWRFDDLGLNIKKYEKTHAMLYHVTFFGLQSKYSNNYLPRSKAVNKINMICDKTGRVISAEQIEYWLTDIDYHIVCEMYHIDRTEVHSIYASRKKYLDKKVMQFILDAYSDKTTLKGKKGATDEETAEIEQIYLNKKQRINSLYGISVTNILNQSTEYDTESGKWTQARFDKAFINKKLDESKESYSTLFFFAVGVWVTAIARSRLILGMTGFSGEINKRVFKENHDLQTVYYDTDSLKMIGDNAEYFKKVNDWITARMQKSCDDNDLDWNEYAPYTQKGECKPLGLFDYEGRYDEFKTLGSKCYAFRKKGEICITVAGVPKRNKNDKTKQPTDIFKNDLNNFNPNTKIPYEYTGKLTHVYNDEMPDIEFYDYLGNKQIVKGQRHGMALIPTDYTLGDFSNALSILQTKIDKSEIKEVTYETKK